MSKPKKNIDKFDHMIPGSYFDITLPKVNENIIVDMMCCDCNLVHIWDFQRRKGNKLRIRVFRDEHATKKARRRKK